MSTDRLERRLPEVLTELSLPRMPDYVDNLLQRTSRMPQRSGWTFPERWFPMSTLTAALPTRRLPLRPLIALAIIVALVVASLALYAGTQRRLPPLFGPAANGLVVTNNAAGDIVAVDPGSGATRTLVAGPKLCCSTVAPTGQRISFMYSPAGEGSPTGLTIANIDGSVIREIPGDDLAAGWLEWAPAGDRLLITTASGAVIVDIATGKVTPITGTSDLVRAAWIGATGDILLASRPPDTAVNSTTLRIDRLAAGKTSDPTEVATIYYTIDPPLVSPDGSRFLYNIWGPEDRLHGDVHVFDFATATDKRITEEAFDDGIIWENPVWSPDSTRIAVQLIGSDGYYQIAIIPATGGDPVLTGSKVPAPDNGALLRFSPDGMSLLVTFRKTQITWIYPVAGGVGRQVAWTTTEDNDWQRLP